MNNFRGVRRRNAACCGAALLLFYASKLADSVVCLIFDIVGDRDEEKSFALHFFLGTTFSTWRVRSRRRVAQAFQIYKSEACRNA